MRVEIRYNPASGRGRAGRTALRFERALRGAGHDPRLLAVGQESASERAPDLLLLVGGDGTVKHAIADATALGIPVYHVPLGNENLFAREFGMSRDPDRLCRAIEAWTIDTIDIGRVEELARDPGPSALVRHEPFSIMLSVGPDASVIHRMQRDGRTASGHLAYLAPISDELADPCLVPITARVDGRTIVDSRPGLIVVANLRQYGFRINPAARADAHDALLDIVFIPAATVAPILRAAAWARFGRLLRVPGVLSVRGGVVELDAPGGLAQVDGEALTLATPLRITARPAALRVLRPRHAALPPLAPARPGAT